MATPAAHRIALISTPWQDPFSPSIQLGTLTAYVRRERPEVPVDTYDLFLELADAIDVHLAKRISVSWIGEALFAYILFPTQARSIATYLEHSRRDDPAFRSLDFGAVIEALRTTLRARLDSVDWSVYSMVGLSVVFAQTFSSLLTAREIKKRAPDVPIVLGGPGCTNEIGRSFLDHLPFVDYVVNGEGETPLVNLIDALAATPGALDLAVPAVMSRSNARDAAGELDQLPDLSTLPPPDYDGYFTTVASCRAAHDVLGRVRIPIETSRGCWWDRSHLDPMRSCAFCNLNLQWRGYREKGVEQSVGEIEHLVDRYRTADVTLVDNILRMSNVDSYIDGLKELDRGLDIWMEARVSIKPEDIGRLRDAGARVVQFGVEALSTSVLRKMIKGTTTIRNLQAMKFCEHLGVKNTANLIVDFPGLTDEDIDETLVGIEFARGYRPLDVADFSLVYQAPAYKSPDQFDIEHVRNYHMYEMLLPPELYTRLFLTEKSFDSVSLERQRPRWAQVRRALAAWAEHYERTRPVVEGNLLLSMQDGGTFLKIRDFRTSSPRFTWLDDVRRDVYLACDTIISVERLTWMFPTLREEEVRSFLDEWVCEKLAFVEDDTALALAVPWGPVSKRRNLPMREATRSRRLIPLLEERVPAPR